MISDEDAGIRLKALMYLTDRRDGKAKQLEDQSKESVRIVVIGAEQLQQMQQDVMLLPPAGEA